VIVGDVDSIMNPGMRQMRDDPNFESRFVSKKLSRWWKSLLSSLS
jgi:hypothetical protein